VPQAVSLWPPEYDVLTSRLRSCNGPFGIVDVERPCPSTAHFEDCTYSGAEFPSKKTLDSVQNLENKGPVKILPCRSMVFKVVTGKIL
jgi:hypothetical protein